MISYNFGEIRRYFYYGLNLLVLALFIQGCSPSIALFDQHSYEELTSLKVDAVNLIEKSAEPYDNYADQVDALHLRFQKVKEYVKGLSKNDITYHMLENLTDPNKNLYGGAIKLWQQQGSISPAIVSDFKERVQSSFDEILELERNKIKK